MKIQIANHEMIERDNHKGSDDDIESNYPKNDEQQPLLHANAKNRLPSDILMISRIEKLDEDNLSYGGGSVDTVTKSLRSDDSSTCTVEKYLASSILERAFPERMIALIVTLIIEIPVLLMISGGSDRICQLIGRRKYQLLIAFLPLTSAISGNCGLQASTLTTRAISHRHVTRSSYTKWLRMEICAALYLGIGIGFIIGSIAYIASDFDVAFGLTLFTAQVISIFTAGCTGTLAPMMFTFVFYRDSGKWGGPLETAIQDIIGSFAMVVLSYQLLLLLGSNKVEPSDMCGSY